MTLGRTFRAEHFARYVALLGYPEALPTQDGEALFAGLSGVIPTWESAGDSVLTHEGAFSAVYRDGKASRQPSPVVGLQPATGSQQQLRGDDMVVALWVAGGELRIGVSRGKVNADRKSAGNTNGAAQICDGMHRYWLSNFGYDEDAAEVFRARDGQIVVARDLDVDGEVSLQELIAGGLSLQNLSVLMHAMGLSEGCWGPLAAAWGDFLRLGKGHLSIRPREGIPCLHWPGTDLFRWLEAGMPGAWWPLLRPGCRGRRVTVLQGLLTNAGHPLQPDGLFGPATARALLAWRAVRGTTTTRPHVGDSDWLGLGAPVDLTPAATTPTTPRS